MVNMMLEIEDIYNMFSEQSGTVEIFFLLLVVLFFASKNKRLKLYFIMPSFLILLFITNPISMKVFVESGFIEANRYVRLYWLLPVGLVVAYGATFLIKIAEKESVFFKRVCFVMIMIMMLFFGDYMFTEENFSEATNIYKLPSGVVEVTDIICEDVITNGGEITDIRIAVPLSLSSYIRQYNADIKMLYGRNSEATVTANEVRRLMKEDEYNIHGLQSYLRRGSCSYVVLDADKKQIGNIEEYGYILIGETNGYLIYKDLECEEHILWGEIT